MDFRLATMQDLPLLQETYREIIREMYKNHLPIWDDIYPCEFFKADIGRQQLYLLEEQRKIVSAFALCSSHPGGSSIAWENPCGKPLYMDRFGVNPQYARQGLGGAMLEQAKETAKSLGAEYLRLFVVDFNIPAARLYVKSGFRQAEGVFHEVIDETCSFHEYGYETRL